MDMHVRLNVTCSFSITLGVSVNRESHDSIQGEDLKRVVAQHVRDHVRLDPDAGIDRIEIAEIATDGDSTIVRGTNG